MQENIVYKLWFCFSAPATEISTHIFKVIGPRGLHTYAPQCKSKIPDKPNNGDVFLLELTWYLSEWASSDGRGGEVGEPPSRLIWRESVRDWTEKREEKKKEGQRQDERQRAR